MTGEGGGGGEKETLARKPHNFEKLRSPANDWFDRICGRRLQMLWSDIYSNHVCAKVYQI